MRAAHRDIELESGTDFELAIEHHHVDKATPLSALALGDVVSHEGNLWPVHSIATDHRGTLHIELGRGLRHEPSLYGKPDETVLVGVPQIWEAAQAGFVAPLTMAPPTTIELETAIVGDTTCVLRVPGTDIAWLRDLIDSKAIGPSSAVFAWDLIGTFGGRAQRVLEGQMVVIRSSADLAKATP